MKTLLFFSAIVVTAPIASAQVRIETAPRAYSYTIGDPDRAMIGVSTRTSGKRDSLGLLVESVTRDGPADKAGIEEGDRLVSIGTVNLRLSAGDAGESDMDGVATRRLIRELEKRKAGDEVELRVYREGNMRTVRVKTVTADELNGETLERFGTLTQRRVDRDRAALGISLGGNGSRRDTLGILVVGVSDSSPAAKAGIDEGDRIASINGVDLRVAGEDAGDWQASSSRINRLNREMEKVKAGDAVELRVHSGGQMKSIRVESVKASDIESEGFFFGTGRGAIAIPRLGGVRVRPPMVEYYPEPAKSALKADIERSMQSLKEALKQRSSDMKLQTEALKSAAKVRTIRIA